MSASPCFVNCGGEDCMTLGCRRSRDPGEATQRINALRAHVRELEAERDELFKLIAAERDATHRAVRRTADALARVRELEAALRKARDEAAGGAEGDTE